jgi:hypothetical protein
MMKYFKMEKIVSFFIEFTCHSSLSGIFFKKKDSEQVGMTGKNKAFHLERTPFSVLLLLTSCFFLLTVSSCGYQIHNRAALPFKAIKIGKIENKTLEPKLQDRLYTALTEEFLKQGVDVSPAAGYKISGTIHQFDLRVLSEKSDVAADYELIIKADFTLTDPSGKAKEFKNITSPFIISFSGTGPLNDLIASKELAYERAMRDMAMEIVAALIYR